MRLAILITLCAAAASTVSGCSRAEAFESFTLEQNDHIIAENPGCYASCSAFGSKRTCTIKSLDCRAVCESIPECSVNGRMVRVCAIIRTRQ